MEIHTRTDDRHQIWRQVGWLTHVSKNFHRMGTPEPIHDRGGYSPVWELIENDLLDERPWKGPTVAGPRDAMSDCGGGS